MELGKSSYYIPHSSDHPEIRNSSDHCIVFFGVLGDQQTTLSLRVHDIYQCVIEGVICRIHSCLVKTLAVIR